MIELLDRVTDIKYGKDYPQWYRLYHRILLDYKSSMSLERIFRMRKLYQLAICANYS